MFNVNTTGMTHLKIHNPLFPGKIILPPILNMATNPNIAGDLKFAVQESRR
jgi:hypothetical protein